MNLKQYFTINYWLNCIVLVISVNHIDRFIFLRSELSRLDS